MNINPDDLYDQHGGAKYLGISWHTLRSYAWNNRIKSTKIFGRVLFTKEQLDEFKKNRQPKGRPSRKAGR
jgi:excisionase family DNA binding protein